MLFNKLANFKKLANFIISNIFLANFQITEVILTNCGFYSL